MSGFHWLVSYPKSGNTWLRLSLASLARDGAAPTFDAHDDFGAIASDRGIFDVLLDVDSSDLTNDEIERLRPRLYEAEAQRQREPQVRKVHDAWTCTSTGEPLFPTAVTRSVIYIVRDPRDVAVSLSHHIGKDLDFTIGFMGWDGATFASRHGGPQLAQRILSWSAHVRSWLDAPVTPFLLRYEDMVADPAGKLAEVAAHLGWVVSPEAVLQAVEATRFDALRAQEDLHGFAEKPEATDRFFRKGVAGDWRNVLSNGQAARIEAAHADVMARLGYRRR